MARKSQPIISVTGGTPRGGQVPPRMARGIDRVLSVQRPVVLAHLAGIRRRHPELPPAGIVVILERRYVAAVTTGGAAVGATAVIPAIGTATTLALAGLETAGFLEATALFAQSLSEVHGLTVAEPERARALVMAMMLGREGSELVRQFAGEATRVGPVRSRYWGELITSTLPSVLVEPLVDRLKNRFIRTFATRSGGSILARAVPFGIGAVIGGVGNNIVARRTLQSSRLAFGPPPEEFPAALTRE